MMENSRKTKKIWEGVTKWSQIHSNELYAIDRYGFPVLNEVENAMEHMFWDRKDVEPTIKKAVQEDDWKFTLPLREGCDDAYFIITIEAVVDNTLVFAMKFMEKKDGKFVEVDGWND